jgi:hypothetical protein
MRAYGDTLQQQCRCIIETSDHGYAFTGSTLIPLVGAPSHYDVWVVRLDPDGEVVWSNHYGGLADDCGYAIRQTADGGFIVAGYYTYPSAPTNRDVYLVKLDSLGAKQWEQKFGAMRYDEANDVQVLVGGNGYIVAGYTQKPSGTFNSNVYLVKTDLQGNIMESGIYNATINDVALGVVETKGGFVACGHVQGAASYDVLLLKTTADLDSTWLKTYGGSASDVGYDIERTSDFGFIVAGRRTVTETGIVNAWALRTNTSGDTLWTRTMTDDIHNWFQSVDITSDGGYVFAGLYTGGSLAAREIYAVRLSGDGAVEWETFYGTSTEDVGMSIAQIFSGDYIIGGYTGLSGSGAQDALVVKTGAMSGVTRRVPVGGRDGSEVAAPAIAAYPNPSEGAAVVELELGVAGKADITVYDVTGKPVAHLFSGTLAPGRQVLQWNGRDLDGRDAPAGVYFCKLAVGAAEATTKVVLAR